LKENKYVQYAVRGATQFEILMTIDVKHPREIDNFINELRINFFEIIQTPELMLITENLQYNLFPKGLLS